MIELFDHQKKNPPICFLGEDGPGWSTTWKMALWARLFNSENAYRMVLKLITIVPPGEKVDFEGGLYNNLWTAHPIPDRCKFWVQIHLV